MLFTIEWLFASLLNKLFVNIISAELWNEVLVNNFWKQNNFRQPNKWACLFAHTSNISKIILHYPNNMRQCAMRVSLKSFKIYGVRGGGVGGL